MLAQWPFDGLEFGVESGVIGEIERGKLADTCWSTLSVVALAQSKEQFKAGLKAGYDIRRATPSPEYTRKLPFSQAKPRKSVGAPPKYQYHP
jgi:hypothetical protein